jgi:hypothetical protein
MNAGKCYALMLVLLLCVACSGGSDGPPAQSGPGTDSGPTNDSNADTDTDKDNNGALAQCLTDQSVHVDTVGGIDDSSCGGSNAPCASIGHGLDRAAPGDVVCVHSGIYHESYLEIPGDVTLVSADGHLAAAIFSGDQSAVRFTNHADNAGIDGFEVYGSWDQGPAGDGLIRVHDAANITIRNTMAHDAPYDQDVIKVSGRVSGLLIENVVAWHPAHRSDNIHFQEVIDIFGSGASGGDPPPVSNVTVRGCWLFHKDNVGDWLIYSKIYAEKIVYENNVFGPSAGMGWGNAAVGIGTGEAGIPDATAAVVDQAIVRNNIFAGLKGDAAFAIMNADNTWVYNNTFYGNSGPDLRSVIMLRGNSHALGPARIFNNIFVNNHPSKGGGTFFWVRDSLPTPWYLHNNLFYDNITASDITYGDQPTDIAGQDPGLAEPAVPNTDLPDLAGITALKENFAISSGSAAADKGVDAVGGGGHPNWAPGETDRRWDATGAPRPEGDPWDLGAQEVE